MSAPAGNISIKTSPNLPVIKIHNQRGTEETVCTFRTSISQMLIKRKGTTQIQIAQNQGNATGYRGIAYI